MENEWDVGKIFHTANNRYLIITARRTDFIPITVRVRIERTARGHEWVRWPWVEIGGEDEQFVVILRKRFIY